LTLAVANDVWAMDYVHDQLYDGRKIGILTVINAFTRFVPASEVSERFTGAEVVTALERVFKEVGYPKLIRVDQGAELVSKDLDLWAYVRGVELDISRPGEPTDNAFIESSTASSGRSAYRHIGS
jgi:putative transposase